MIRGAEAAAEGGLVDVCVQTGEVVRLLLHLELPTRQRAADLRRVGVARTLLQQPGIRLLEAPVFLASA